MDPHEQGNATGAQRTEEIRRQRSETRRSQTYKEFLETLRREGSLDEATAEKAAVSVLCALELRLELGEAAKMEAQLPKKLTELLHRCERHDAADLKPRDIHRERFVQMVADDLGTGPEEAERAIRAVFQTLRERIGGKGEVDQVIHQLPSDLRDLWSAPA